MNPLYYIAMQEDASLSVVTAEEAWPFPKDNLFGPYRTHHKAVLALECAEIDFFYILFRLNAL